jgi:hypothetical protein
MLKKFVPLILLASASAACAYPTFSDIKAPPVVEEPVVGEVIPEKVQKIEVVEKDWKCPGCNENEKYVLKELQNKTMISDRNALATIMGNIKSESQFHPNICEGGARVPYEKCLRGGYGLIQWTSIGRYRGLGTFCKRYGCDPSSLEGQVRYMINEPQFQKVLPEFEGHGQPIHQYMVGAYYWLGWGIKGRRETYAYNYSKKLILA